MVAESHARFEEGGGGPLLRRKIRGKRRGTVRRTPPPVKLQDCRARIFPVGSCAYDEDLHIRPSAIGARRG